MDAMGGVTLLAEARSAGLRVRAEGERLVIEGPRAAAPLAERLTAQKGKVLHALMAERRDPAADWWADSPAAVAPIVWTPPRECCGPVACSRIGPCDRHAAGRPCRIESTEEVVP